MACTTSTFSSDQAQSATDDRRKDTKSYAQNIVHSTSQFLLLHDKLIVMAEKCNGNKVLLHLCSIETW